jgi:hypothetical protein
MANGTLDCVTDREAINVLETEYPGWLIFRQGKGIWLNSCFARNRETGERVEAEDWTDLRDQLRQATSKLESC